MDSNISASDLDQDFFFGPVTQRELIITWKRRRQEKLKKQQAEALKNEDDATKTASVDSEEPDLKKSRVQTTEQKSSTTAGDQLSANTSDSIETGNIDANGRLQDTMTETAENHENDEKVLPTSNNCSENEPEETPILGECGKISEIQEESLSSSLVTPNIHSEGSVCSIQKIEGVTPDKNVEEEVSESKSASCSTSYNAAPAKGDQTDNSPCDNQWSDDNVSTLEENRVGPTKLQESGQPVDEAQSSFHSVDLSIGKTCGEVTENVTEAQVSLLLETHQSSNILAAADEKVADEQSGDVSTVVESAPSIVDHVETQSKDTSNRNPELSINDISCEINESVFEPATSQELSLEPEAHRCGNIQTAADEKDEQLDEASGMGESTQPIADLGETKSKDSSYCSADLSKGEICDDIVQSVATPQLSLEPEALQAGNLSASDENEADDETGICEKFMDESDQPIDTQSKETSFYSADLSINEMCAVINESVAESTSEQKVFLDLEAHQSGNLQNPPDDQSRNCEIPVAEVGYSNTAVLNTSCKAAGPAECVLNINKFCENQEAEVNVLAVNHLCPSPTQEASRSNNAVLNTSRNPPPAHVDPVVDESSGNDVSPQEDNRVGLMTMQGHHKPDLLNRPSEAFVDQENNKENGPVHLSSVKAEDRGSAKPPASGILTPSDGSHSGISQSVETVYKSHIRKPSIIKPATLNVDPSTLKVNTSWAKRFNPSKIPKPKIPYYVQPLDKK